jgi:hypothetical protein
MIEMKIRGLTLDPLTNMPIIILKDSEGKHAPPIWVGIFEANAIALEMENISTPRPMTHDLIKNILVEAKAIVSHIVIDELKDNTFFAKICIKANGNETNVDSRPSDAIALALRLKVPVYVEEKVVEEAKSIDLSEKNIDLTDKSNLEDPSKWKKWLENLKPEDFGKYKM